MHLENIIYTFCFLASRRCYWYSCSSPGPNTWTSDFVPTPGLEADVSCVFCFPFYCRDGVIEVTGLARGVVSKVSYTRGHPSSLRMWRTLIPLSFPMFVWNCSPQVTGLQFRLTLSRHSFYRVSTETRVLLNMRIHKSFKYHLLPYP